MDFTNFRLKFRRFLRVNKNILLLIFLIWAMIYFVNLFFKYRLPDMEPITTLEKHKTVIDDSVGTPKSIQDDIEEYIANYVEACNIGEFDIAYKMLSDDCRKYSFEDSLDKFETHVRAKIPTKKRFSLQSYSKIKVDNTDRYIYEVKYFDDYLATGLTDQDYSFTSEKMTFYKNKNDEIEMSVGSYIFHDDVKNITENEYLKIDVREKFVTYETEEYIVRFTNRSKYTIVIANGEENDEVALVLPNETRKRTAITEIVLLPGESLQQKFEFAKFVDDGDEAEAISFPSVRVMEKYSGVIEVPKEVIQSEVDNAVAKMSMTVSL